MLLISFDVVAAYFLHCLLKGTWNQVANLSFLPQKVRKLWLQSSIGHLSKAMNYLHVYFCLSELISFKVIVRVINHLMRHSRLAELSKS